MKSFKQYINEGVFDFLKGKEKINIRGWKSKIHKGKHPDVKDVNKDATILFAIDPKTGEEHHIASGRLSDADIKKHKRMYGLK
tara:strand:+ start:2412 stop:2660 length:249 start_codon:yes stop_codon:yes gene_type:complete